MANRAAGSTRSSAAMQPTGRFRPPALQTADAVLQQSVLPSPSNSSAQPSPSSPFYSSQHTTPRQQQQQLLQLQQPLMMQSQVEGLRSGRTSYNDDPAGFARVSGSIAGLDERGMQVRLHTVCTYHFACCAWCPLQQGYHRLTVQAEPCGSLYEGVDARCVLVQAEHDRRLADLEASFAERLAGRKVALETEMRRQLEGLRQQQAVLEAQVLEQVGGTGISAAAVQLVRPCTAQSPRHHCPLSQLCVPMSSTGAV
jgi:hypothetical protein